MTKASDNAFPSLLITEGTEPSAPAAGKQRLYIDSTTHLLKATNSSGTDRTIEGGGGSALASASYTRTAGDYTRSASSFADVDATNLKLTIVTGARRVLVVFTGVCNITGAGSYAGFDVSLDGTRLINTTYGQAFQSPVGNYWVNASFSYLTDVLSAASHEFRLMWRGDGTQTATLNGSSNLSLRFAVMEQGG
jgi:hypothetical protein